MFYQKKFIKLLHNIITEVKFQLSILPAPILSRLNLTSKSLVTPPKFPNTDECFLR